MPSVFSGLLSSVVAIFAIALHSGGAAATAQGSFLVTVKLAGICISSTLSQQTNALVRVTCQGNQFVSIEPRPGTPFVGTHGGAYRFAFSQRLGSRPFPPGFLTGTGELEDAIGQGTITALRLLDLRETDKRLELLVSF